MSTTNTLGTTYNELLAKVVRENFGTIAGMHEAIITVRLTIETLHQFVEQEADRDGARSDVDWDLLVTAVEAARPQLRKLRGLALEVGRVCYRGQTEAGAR